MSPQRPSHPWQYGWDWYPMHGLVVLQEPRLSRIQVLLGLHQHLLLVDGQAPPQDIACVRHGGVRHQQALEGTQALLAALGADCREVQELESANLGDLAGDGLELRPGQPQKRLLHEDLEAVGALDMFAPEARRRSRILCRLSLLEVLLKVGVVLHLLEELLQSAVDLEVAVDEDVVASLADVA